MNGKSETKAVIALAIISGLSILIAFLTPHPYNLWALVAMVTSSSSLILTRAVDGIFADKLPFSLTPYIIATLLALSLVFFFAPMDYARIAGIIYVSIMGVVMFYWLVWAFVSSFKETWLKGKED